MHEPVLLAESLDFLNVRQGGAYIDGTVGGGGHARAILERAMPGGTVLGIDRDREALARLDASSGAASGGRFGSGLALAHGNFADMATLARARGIEAVDGILLDLGVSSDQLDTGERGFSFMKDAPLDMRMDRSAEGTAEEWIRTLPESELARIIREYGEERMARRIARVIVEERLRRPLKTTGQLASLICRATGRRTGRIHPATRTFQALRMAVNGELDSLRAGLTAGLDLLKAGGRMVAISFHSLEDREVKRRFRSHAGRQVSLQSGGSAWEGIEPRVRILTRKPVAAGAAERAANPRARSAKLRAVERV